MIKSREFIEARCEKIPEAGCWVWVNALDGVGYGSFRDQNKGTTKRAHRAAYEAYYGPIPDGAWVLHRCDNRACCNPHHLFLGSRRDNIDDAVKKGRLKGITRNRPSGLHYNWTRKPGPHKYGGGTAL